MIRWIVDHGASVVLLILAILVFGGMSYATLPREASPDVKIPVVLVSTPYIGVSPADMESLVTIPIENELAGLKDVKKMSSTSAEGVSIVTLEFEPDVVIEDALQRVRDRTNRARRRLPEDVEEPDIREISFSDFPIMMVTIAGDEDQETLKLFAEGIEDRVSRIPGVLETRITGGLTREVHVQIDPRRLSMYGLSFDNVTNAIRDENINIPGGDVAAGNSTFLVRVPGEFTDARQIEAVAVKRVGDRPVFVRDLGRVVDGWQEAESYARMNGQPAVSLAVTKRAGASIIDIADEVRVIALEESEAWPAGVDFRVLADQSKQIRDMVSDLENNIITALLLVMAVLLVSMGLRSSLFVASAIPLSMLMSMVFIDAFGMTLNMIVLFSLILALGMLVDNGIVIVENIYRHLEEGKSPVRAAIDGTSEVALAVAASTATTVAAFFPLVFWSGIMGEFMGYLPKTVIIVLTSSLLVAVVVLPVATAALFGAGARRKPVSNAGDPEGAHAEKPPGPIMSRYRQLLVFSIQHRYLSAAAGVASLVITFVIYGMFNHGTEFFPKTEPDRATIAIRAPDGTDLEATDRVVRRIEVVLNDLENVDVYVAESGMSGGGNAFGGAQANPSQAQITVDFQPHANDAEDGQTSRVENTEHTIDAIRAAVVQIPGVEIEVRKQEMGPPVGAAIAVEVSGEDFHEVGEYAATVRRRISSVEGVTDLSDDYRVGRPEMRLRINRGAAKRVGASTSTVANNVRTAIAGTKASALRDGKDEYDIIVEADPRFRDSLQDVLALRIPGRLDTSPKTFQVPLSAVATYELAGGSGSIRHVDQKLVVTITAKIAEGYNENAVRGGVVTMLDEIKSAGEVPPGLDLRLGGANDEQQAAATFLGRAFLIAVGLIAVVLVTQFNNFKLPFIILFTVLLSLVGVLWGLMLTGTPFGVIMTGLGVISLAGVVVNNAIVLLDYVERLRERGMPMNESLVRAGMTRFRPVVLTAVTTILGLVPMALGISIDFREMRLLVGGGTSQFWGPMAVAVIFGLAFATLLTLVMVPTLYGIFEDLGDAWKRFRGKAPVAAPVPTAIVGVLLAMLAAQPADALSAPVTLEQAVNAAMSNNLSAEMVREIAREKETLPGQAWTLVSPKISAQATYTINQREVALDPSSFGDPSALAEGNALLMEGLADTFEALHPDPIGAAVGQGYREAADEIRAAADSASGGEAIVIQQKTAWAGNLSLVQPIFTASAIPTLSAAYASVRMAHLDRDRTLQQIRGAATGAFYALSTSREALVLAEEARVSATNHRALAERQVNAGTQPARALVQARLGVSRAERDMLMAREQASSAERAFEQVTGLDGNTEVAYPEPVQVEGDLGTAVTSATGSRSDIQAAQERTQLATYALRAKHLEWLPTIDGRFTWSYTENTGFQDDPTMWMVVFSANWLLWDGGLRIAQAQESASRLRQAEIGALQLRQDAEEEVRKAWHSFVTSEKALEASADEVSLAEENLRLAERGLAAGGTTWLEVEDARLGLLQARISQLQQRVRRDLAAVDVNVASGRY
jgi:multidrug efflux pump